ncbi:hypothetical protein [Streptomyces sp. 2224.1]|uniref:hypothetical protein n=1 Tax=Streptomyces sp. 2224.1 TaxID=1881020 RepID=UPI002109D636|nr:hypothetical protein [Streptomyces sp. 2224.1]
MIRVVQRDREHLARAGDGGAEETVLQRHPLGLLRGGRPRPGGELLPALEDGLRVGREAAVTGLSTSTTPSS